MWKKIILEPIQSQPFNGSDPKWMAEVRTSADVASSFPNLAPKFDISSTSSKLASCPLSSMHLKLAAILNDEQGSNGKSLEFIHNRFTRLSNWSKWIIFFKKNGPTPASFLFIFSLFKQTSSQFLQQINVEKMSIQYTVPGFEPTTFGTWVSSLYH